MQENTARPVTVKDMMLAREARVMRQQALLHKWRMPLLSFCFNIPGPIKSNPLIRRGFALALDRVEYCLARHNISILQRKSCPPTPERRPCWCARRMPFG